MEPFSPFLRSPARIKQASKRHFCDPSLTVVVGVAGAAYRRPDGVYVLPLSALRPK